MEGGWIAAICTGVGVLLGAIAKWLIDYKKEAGNTRRSDAEQLHGQYRELVEEQSQRIDNLQSEVNDVRTKSNAKIELLVQENATCKAESLILRSEITALRQSMIRLQSGVAFGAEMPWQDALVIADENGIIAEWNPAATMMFHWTEDEVLGKNINVLVPPRFKAQHDAAFAEIRDLKRAPRTDRVLKVDALTSENVEIPVDIRLAGWVRNGKWSYGANIRRRIVE